MILGIDPGVANVGWAVVNDGVMIEGGVIVTGVKIDSGLRLKKIKEELVEILKKYDIKAAGIESLFFAKNAKSAIKVAEAIGVIKLTIAEAGVSVKELTPLQVKMAIVGYGRAEKRQVLEMVKVMLGGQEVAGPSHVGDAVAVALTVELGQRSQML
ncbi:MAG: crossover junction endodeoxyribonuclease RuvC [Candidatus Shapirobacteria bacterium]